MLIESITLNNYRLYEGENVIQFRFDEAKNVHLICGENGFGKTTACFILCYGVCLAGLLARYRFQAKRQTAAMLRCRRRF